jgi:hypothetical protein
VTKKWQNYREYKYFGINWMCITSANKIFWIYFSSIQYKNGVCTKNQKDETQTNLINFLAMHVSINFFAFISNVKYFKPVFKLNFFKVKKCFFYETGNYLFDWILKQTITHWIIMYCIIFLRTMKFSMIFI